MTSNIHLFQICYDEKSKKLLDKDFICLDNTKNPRPDWAEYWAIRNVFLKDKFSDDDYIGFFSPRFYEKTHLSGSFVKKCVMRESEKVCSFSPYFDLMSTYLNPFVQGESVHPGLISVTQDFFKVTGVDFDVRSQVLDSTTTIYSNYFVAPLFIWRKWFYLTERLFEICEHANTDLAVKLNKSTSHRNKYNYPLRVFLMERIISVVLYQEAVRAKYCPDIRKMPLTNDGLSHLLGAFMICDSLKGQYIKTKKQEYLDEYFKLTDPVVKSGLLFR